jgi:hypothetical protein
MALPQSLEHALTPQELTFITEEEHIEIVPSFGMSKIRLVSVSSLPSFSYPWLVWYGSLIRCWVPVGRIRTIRTATTRDGSVMARTLAQAEEEMSDHSAGLVDAW